jgi:hypothetical protein
MLEKADNEDSKAYLAERLYLAQSPSILPEQV